MGNTIEYETESPVKTNDKNTVIIYSIDKRYKYIIEVPDDSTTQTVIDEFKQAHAFFSKGNIRSNVCVKCGNGMLEKRIINIALSRYRFVSLDYGWEGYHITPVLKGYIYNSKTSYNNIDHISDKNLKRDIERIIYLDDNRYNDMNPEYSPDGKIILTLPTVDVQDEEL